MVQLNNAGAYQWHTFYRSATNLGGFGLESGKAIAVDGSGNIYVAASMARH